MVYIVHINYDCFEFTDGHTALSFAALALNAAQEETKVEIELKQIPIEEKDEEEDED